MQPERPLRYDLKINPPPLFVYRKFSPPPMLKKYLILLIFLIKFSLNVDPKRGDQLVRGSCVMPAGLGKKIIVAVNCEPHMHDRVKEAGADIIVTNETKNQAKFLIFPCFFYHEN